MAGRERGLGVRRGRPGPCSPRRPRARTSAAGRPRCGTGWPRPRAGAERRSRRRRPGPGREEGGAGSCSTVVLLGGFDGMRWRRRAAAEAPGRRRCGRGRGCSRRRAPPPPARRGRGSGRRRPGARRRPGSARSARTASAQGSRELSASTRTRRPPVPRALHEVLRAAGRADLGAAAAGRFPDPAQEHEVVHQGDHVRHRMDSIAIMGDPRGCTA